MCDRESFAKIRDAIGDLQKADAVQSEQIKTLFKATEQQSKDIKEQSNDMVKLVNRLVLAIIGILLILALAVVFGALGEKGFNGVMKGLPAAVEATKWFLPRGAAGKQRRTT